MMPVPEACATLRFSTEGMPEERRAQAVRDLYHHERTILSARLEPIEPLEPLPDHPLHVDLIKRTLPGLAVVSGTLSGLRQSIRLSGAVANGEDDLLLGVNVSGCSTAHQRDRDLVLRDGDAFFATRDQSGFIAIPRPTPVRFVGCRVPREVVAPLVGRIDDTPLRLVPPRSEALTLVVTYARDCRRSRSRTRRTDLRRLIPGNNLEDAPLFYLQQSLEIHAAVHNIYGPRSRESTPPRGLPERSFTCTTEV